jgi:hypothetical protein
MKSRRIIDDGREKERCRDSRANERERERERDRPIQLGAQPGNDWRRKDVNTRPVGG